MSAANQPLFDNFLSYKDIAHRVGRSIPTIKRWANENYLGFPSPKYLGANAVFREREIILWINHTLSDKPAERDKPHTHRKQHKKSNSAA